LLRPNCGSKNLQISFNFGVEPFYRIGEQTQVIALELVFSFQPRKWDEMLAAAAQVEAIITLSEGKIRKIN
jgi:hypothetical protein